MSNETGPKRCTTEECVLADVCNLWRLKDIAEDPRHKETISATFLNCTVSIANIAIARCKLMEDMGQRIDHVSETAYAVANIALMDAGEDPIF